MGFDRTNRQAGKQGPAQSIGQVSDEPLTWTVTPDVTVGAASGVLLAAATGTGRRVTLYVPEAAVAGIRIDFGAAAGATDFLLEPGRSWSEPTEQEIRAVRAGASDVAVSIMVGVVP